jgi:plasmid replication initiation protein
MNKNKDMVKYHNDLNRLNMATLKEKELELFYAICLKLKEKGIEEITIDISDFKKEFNISNKIDKARFREYIKSVHKKFSELKYTIETEKEIETIIFFKKFKTDLEANKMIITVNKEYSYILNNIVSYYTQFNFREYQSLKSKYSKILMPRLAQWNSVKKIEFLKEDLFEILGVPKSCREKTSNFNNKVLTPIKAELPKVFYNLKVNPIKKSTAKNEIKSYLFSWTDRPKKEIKEVEAEEVKTIEISKKLKVLLDEAIKNPKLELLEKPSIIEYLLKNYTENIIILGIKNLLNSNITTKIKTRKYITTILDQLKTSENIKIVTKEENKNIETKKEIEYIEKTKEKITQEEYNKILDEEIESYIQEAKRLNQNVNSELIKLTLKVKLNSKYKIKN